AADETPMQAAASAVADSMPSNGLAPTHARGNIIFETLEPCFRAGLRFGDLVLTGSGSSPTRYRGLRRPAPVRPADRRAPDDRGLAAQLAHQLVHLPQAPGADRLTVCDQSAIGVDRQRAVDLGF